MATSNGAAAGMDGMELRATLAPSGAQEAVLVKSEDMPADSVRPRSRDPSPLRRRTLSILPRGARRYGKHSCKIADLTCALCVLVLFFFLKVQVRGYDFNEGQYPLRALLSLPLM